MRKVIPRSFQTRNLFFLTKDAKVVPTEDNKFFIRSKSGDATTVDLGDTDLTESAPNQKTMGDALYICTI